MLYNRMLGIEGTFDVIRCLFLMSLCYNMYCTVIHAPMCKGLRQTFIVFHDSTLIHDSAWPSPNCHAIPKPHKLPFNQSRPQSRIPACSDLYKVSVMNGPQYGRKMMFVIPLRS